MYTDDFSAYFVAVQLNFNPLIFPGVCHVLSVAGNKGKQDVAMLDLFSTAALGESIPGVSHHS